MSSSDLAVVAEGFPTESNLAVASPQCPQPAPTGKQRKGQTTEAYEIQRAQFWEAGPRLNTADWFLNHPLESLRVDSKTDKTQLLHTAELCYFRRDYNRCMQIVDYGLVFLQAEAVLEAETKLPVDVPGKQAKKPKLDRHVQELMEIKERCQARLAV